MACKKCALRDNAVLAKISSLSASRKTAQKRLAAIKRKQLTNFRNSAGSKVTANRQRAPGNNQGAAKKKASRSKGQKR